MIERHNLVRIPPSPPSQPHHQAPLPPPALPVQLAPLPPVPVPIPAPPWSEPVQPAPRANPWQPSPSPAIDTMMASSGLMLSQESAMMAAPGIRQPSAHFGATDTVSTIPQLHLPNVPGLDGGPGALPMSWEPAPPRDRAKIALIGAVVVIVVSLITLLILMLTQDSDAPAGGAPGAVESASAAVATPPLPTPPPEPAPTAVAVAAVDSPPVPTADPRVARPIEKHNGTVSFASTPSTHVLLDGKPIGSTPLIGVSVGPGSHRVTFIRGPRDLKTITINVKPDQRSTASVRFD
jgi:hypothetical protein